MGIGTASPNPNAQLNISADNKGLLIPRVNLTATNNDAPIGAWVQGLLVYNLDNAGTAPNNVVANQFYYSNGSRWVAVGTGMGWGLAGNTGTSDGENFIGTTDDRPFNIRVNNQKAGRIDSALSNSFFGYRAGNANTTGSRNTASGREALYSNTEGFQNTASGYRALYSNISSFNTANGVQALQANTTGGSNTASGALALYSTTTGSFNNASGAASLFSNNTGSFNTASGTHALYSNTTGSFNAASGADALRSNTTGSSNTASGSGALYSNTTGEYNTASGRSALRFNSTGNFNTALGDNAGLGFSGVDFNQCTFIGSNSSTTVARTNITMLGFGIGNAQCTGDNQVLLGNTAITQIRAQVSSITTYSDARFKVNVQDNIKGLDFIMRLNPVSYQQDPARLQQIWNPTGYLQASNLDYTEIRKKRFVGFLAQDVEKAALAAGFDFPGIDVPQNDNEVSTLRYVDFIMPMVKAMQEQQGMIEVQRNQMKEQQQQIAELQKLNKQLFSEIINIKAIIEQGER